MRGTFKGFAMLRQIALSSSQPGMPGFGQPQPVYVQGYGFVPPSQVRGGVWGCNWSAFVSGAGEPQVCLPSPALCQQAALDKQPARLQLWRASPASCLAPRRHLLT